MKEYAAIENRSTEIWRFGGKEKKGLGLTSENLGSAPSLLGSTPCLAGQPYSLLRLRPQRVMRTQALLTGTNHGCTSRAAASEAISSVLNGKGIVGGGVAHKSPLACSGGSGSSTSSVGEDDREHRHAGEIRADGDVRCSEGTKWDHA